MSTYCLLDYLPTYLLLGTYCFLRTAYLLGSAMLTLFEMSTLEMWPDVMFLTIDAVSDEQAPTRGTGSLLLATHYLLLTTHYSLLITHYLFILTTCYLLVVTRYYLLLTSNYLIRITYLLLLTTCQLPLATHYLLQAPARGIRPLQLTTSYLPHATHYLLQAPIRGSRPWMAVYCISWIVFSAFFILNLFVGVVLENFAAIREGEEGSGFLTDDQVERGGGGCRALATC